VRSLKRIVEWTDLPNRPLTRALAVIGITCGISTLHDFIPNDLALIDLYYLSQRLYYVPVVFAGLYFGWRGGLAAGILAGLAYLPQILVIWTIHPRYTINQYTEVVLFCIVGALTGVIANREQRSKKTLQETTAQLARLYAELQDNFERMKRAERLYALGQLSSGLAHEIRNPLASIDGATTVLLREPRSEERRVEFLEIIQKECRRLNRLLTAFLNFAKPPVPEYRTTDQGSGVSEQDMERIFDPFFTTKESGTGLGLSVAHQIVLQQSGVLTARRNPKEGMTFSVQLPLDRRRGR